MNEDNRHRGMELVASDNCRRGPMQKEFTATYTARVPTSRNYEQTARALNADSIKTRSGGKWYPATIRRILLNNA